jgi:hypothetical protein
MAESEQLSRYVTVRFTEAELDTIQAEAKRRDFSVSRLLREELLAAMKKARD